MGRGIVGAVPGLRAARKGGRHADTLVVSETLPVDEIARLAVQAPEQAETGGERTTSGTWTQGARTAQRKGGLARKGNVKMASSLGLASMASNPGFAPFLTDAKAWIREQRRELASTYGGGMCGVAPSTLVVAAGWLQAGARFLMSTADGDAKQMIAASSLQDKARIHLLTASQMCAAAAQARPKQNALATFRASLKKDAK